MAFLPSALIIAFLLSLFHASSYNILLLLTMNGLLLSSLITSKAALGRAICIGRYNRLLTIALVLFLFWFALSLIWSQAVAATHASLLIILLFVLSAVAASTLNDSQWQRIRMIVIGTGIVLFFAALGQLLLTDTPRPEAIFLSTNNLAGFFNLLALPALAIYLRSNTPMHPVLSGLLVALLIAGVVFTQSRGAALALLIGIAILALISKPWRKRSLGSALLWVLVGVMLGALLSHNDLGNRYVDTASQIVSASGGDINPRIPIWESTLQMAADKPILGWGGGAFMQAFSAYRPPQFSQTLYNAHNDYLQILVELGPVGLTLFLLLLAATLRSGLVKTRLAENNAASAAAISAALATLAIQMMFSSSLYTTPIVFVSGLYLGRLAAIDTRQAAPTRSIFTLASRAILLLALFHLSTLAISQLYLHRASVNTVPVNKFHSLESASRWDPLNDAPHHLTAKLVLDMLDQGQLSPDDVLDQALNRLDKAQALMPLRRQHYLLRAKLLEYRHPLPTTEIRELYHTTLSLNPKFLSARIAYAEFLTKQDNRADACRILEAGVIERYFTKKTTALEYLSLLINCADSGFLDRKLLTSLPKQLTNIEQNQNDLIHFRLLGPHTPKPYSNT